jgi:serine/threonine-protein kinase
MHNVENDQNIAASPDFSEQYDEVELVGRGGMGSVYKARDRATGELRALKVLRSELNTNRAAMKRFEQEVNAAVTLRHPNLVYVYNLSHTKDGVPFMVMNFIDGEGLDAVIKYDRFIPTERALNIFVQTAKALEHAHAQGIIHRDMKPSNILVSRTTNGEEHVAVVDFGIAKIIAPNIEQTALTQTGELFGSPLYMSPEQCSGTSLDARSDIYSFGCVMYEVLCGKPPFQEENPFQLMLKQVHHEPLAMRVTNPSLTINRNLEYIVMRCLQKEAIDRYQTITEVRRDLELVQANKHIKRRLQTNSRKMRSFVKFALILILSFGVSWGLFALLTYLSSSFHGAHVP